MIFLPQRVRLMRFITSLGKASCMVYTESQLLLPKGIKICLNHLRFAVFRETKLQSGHEACSMMGLKSDFHPWHEKRLAIVPCDMNQADCTKTLTASASCDSVRFAQFCLLSHSSRAMCPTLLSLLSLGESRKTRLERVMVEIRRSSHH